MIAMKPLPLEHEHGAVSGHETLATRCRCGYPRVDVTAPGTQGTARSERWCRGSGTDSSQANAGLITRGCDFRRNVGQSQDAETIMVKFLLEQAPQRVRNRGNQNARRWSRRGTRNWWSGAYPSTLCGPGSVMGSSPRNGRAGGDRGEHKGTGGRGVAASGVE